MANRCFRVLGAGCWVLGASVLGASVLRALVLGASVLGASGLGASGLGASGLGASVLLAQAPAQPDPQAQAQRAAERLAALQRESEALAKQERTLLAELRKLEIEREIRVVELTKVQREITDAQKQLAATTARAAQLERQVEKQRPDVEARMVQLYKMGRAGYWRMLLDVNSLRELARAYRTAAALGRIDRDRLEEHRRTVAALAAERASLQARIKQLTELRKKAVDARAAADRAVAARTALVQSIDERRDLNAQLTGELQEAQRKLQATFASNAASATAPSTSTALPIRPFQGSLPWPSEGVLSSPFGRQPPRSPGPAVRNGIELSLPEGQPVRAVHDGTVAYADLFTGYANLVIVEHAERSYSLYGHLSSLSVKRGDHVAAGTVVGLAGRNPAGNPSLYFELRVDGRPVDPLQWLKK
jgi:murein hydrolase activator